jgi:hypothetical protein
MGRVCSTNGEKGYAYRLLMEEPEGKRPLARLRCSCMDITCIKMDLTEVGWKSMDWIDLALVNMVMNLQVA